MSHGVGSLFLAAVTPLDDRERKTGGQKKTPDPFTPVPSPLP